VDESGIISNQMGKQIRMVVVQGSPCGPATRIRDKDKVQCDNESGPQHCGQYSHTFSPSYSTYYELKCTLKLTVGLNRLITNSVEQSHSYEADSRIFCQEFSHCLWNPEALFSKPRCKPSSIYLFVVYFTTLFQ
jgi:hypothetical protein